MSGNRRSRDDKSFDAKDSYGALRLSTKSKVDDESRKNLKWLSFAKSKVSFGFKHLPPAAVPSMSSERRAFSICFDKICNWSIPPQVLNEFGKGDYEMVVQLSLSMIHLNTSSFFGSTWMGPEVELSSQLPKFIDFKYEDVVYMTTRITDPSCVGVVEVVATKYDRRRNLRIAQYGCGWTMINFFSKPFPPDIAHGYENVSMTSCAMFAGSPRDLILNNDMQSLASKLKELPDCSLFFKIYSHHGLLRARKLISENEVIGRFDIVPGLVRKTVTPAGQTATRQLACIGDEELVDQNGVTLIPMRPAVALPTTLKVTNCQLCMPRREQIELRLNENFAKNLQDQDSKADDPKAQILSRLLKIGLHNGHSIVSGDWQTFRLLEDDRDREILYTAEEVLSIRGYVPHELMSLVFIVEYEVGVPVFKKQHFDSSTLVTSSTVVAGKFQTMIHNLTLGAVIYIPSDGKTVHLKNTAAAATDEEGVDIELKLRRDEICSILSPKPLLLDPGQDALADLRDQTDFKFTGSSLENLRASRVAKLSATGGVSFAADAKKPADANADEEPSTNFTEELESVVLGFDLKMVHPTAGSINDGEDVEHLTFLEDTRRQLPNDDNDDEDEEDLGKQFRNEDSKRSRDLTLSVEPLRASRDQLTPRFSKRDVALPRDEELFSVADSIVTGDSDRSALRLDPSYYHARHHVRDHDELSVDDFDDGEPAPARDRHRDRNHEYSLKLPKSNKSLLGKSLQTKLINREQSAITAPTLGQKLSDLELLDGNQGFSANRGTIPKTNIALDGIDAHVRGISRAARSRLNRHGFAGAVVDSEFEAAVRQVHGHAGQQAVSLDVEFSDELMKNEITLQFAGFRTSANVSDANDKVANLPSYSSYEPRSIFCSFQFYTCLPTRTEVMRLLPAADGNKLCVLARDEAHARDETPLALRYVVDTSASSPSEPTEFAQYLSRGILFVEVWDADAMLLLGTAGIPLRKLMRQGKPFMKQAIECDVINPDVLSQSQSGLTTCIVADGGPVAGSIVGALYVMLSNAGSKGSSRSQFNAFASRKFIAHDGLNWRALGGQPSDDALKSKHRAKNSVRAKPLSETTPELSKVLTDVRNNGPDRHYSASMRSLSTLRGDGSVSTLTYDEVATVFKRFQGRTKGLVQYAGDLMALLDVPSWNVAVRKLLHAFRKYADYDGFRREMLRYSNGDSQLSGKDLEEFMRDMFDKLNIHFRPEELTLLSQKFVTENSVDGRDVATTLVRPEAVVQFCADEADRQEWSIIGNRFRRAVQGAYMEDVDVEQLLSNYDREGGHFISANKFKEFLLDVSKFGKLSNRDMIVICKQFSRRAQHATEARRNISMREVMAFLGKDYIGNLESRVRSAIFHGDDISDKTAVNRLLQALLRSQSIAPSSSKNGFHYEDVEQALREFGVFNDLTHDQVRSIILKADKKKVGAVTAAQLLSQLGIKFSAADLAAVQSPTTLSVNTAVVETSPTDLFAILLEKVQNNGVAVDEAFRHFDQNGDGSITTKELAEGLSSLRIFDHIPNWKMHLPKIVAQFDIDGDGEVSLREFFKFLKVEYAPNIIQRMTKIFALVTLKGLNFKDIFKELDEDGNGQLDVDEILLGLKKLGTFGEVAREDALEVVRQFDEDGDQEISIQEFTDFFSARVDKVLKDRRRKHTDKIVKQFRDIMKSAQAKGVTTKDIFGHFDKDKGGTVSTDEMAQALRVLPNFKSLKEEDIRDLIDVLDEDKSGDVDLHEFEAFVRGNEPEEFMSAADQGLTLVDCLRDVFKTAQSKGLSFRHAFSLLDKDGSGEISLDEFERILRQFPSFKKFSHEQFREIFDIIDTDHSNEISINEFEAFVKSGKTIQDHRRLDDKVVHTHRFDDDHGPAERTRKELDKESATELLVRHMRRISEIDGSVGRLIAYLDDDEDGLISTSVLKNLLRREDVFDSLPEDAFDAVVAPLLTDDKTSIKVGPLLQMLEGRQREEPDEVAQYYQVFDEDKEFENKVLVTEYQFSNDPEVRSLEKKLRGFGRILAKRGIDVESLFRAFDPANKGSIRRTEFVEVLSKMGMYILEHGKVFDQALHPDTDLRRLQVNQINRIKGNLGGDYLHNAPRMARKLLMNDGLVSRLGDGEFKEHLESMTLVNWYRQGQKQELLQRVLSHSLALSIRLYPRFGKALFFECPFTNPFAHEERFQIEINDPELRIVTAYDEWLLFRSSLRPCVGELGNEPVEAEMFDRDGQGNAQVALLPHETIHIPFAFMTLVPFTRPGKAYKKDIHDAGSRKRSSETKSDYDEAKIDSEHAANNQDDTQNEEAKRVVEVKFVSGSHGHIVFILKVLLCPRPFVLSRTMRFVEPENSIMKRRVQLVGHENMSLFPGEFTTASKYIHCVEGTGLDSFGGDSRVVVEWSASSEHFKGLGSLDLLIRYRCGGFPSTGTFFLLVYNDPYQIQLHEVWQVIVQTAQRMDIHAVVGSPVVADLVVRGDRFARRARTFASITPFDRIGFRPEQTFQLLPGAYNKVTMKVNPLMIGTRRIQMNMVDMDSRELVSSWILVMSASAPPINRSYDIELQRGKPTHKKIVFQNPWDTARRFSLSSSDYAVMKPRSDVFEVAPNGSAYLRLWFNGLEAASNASLNTNTGQGARVSQVYLFLNDADSGQNEECYLFNVKPALADL